MDLRAIPRPPQAVAPIFKLTPVVAGKLFFGFGLSTIGLYYVSAGKKHQDAQKMVLGAFLVLVALFLF